MHTGGSWLRSPKKKKKSTERNLYSRYKRSYVQYIVRREVDDRMKWMIDMIHGDEEEIRRVIGSKARQ